jgi:hypothetical protein
MKMRLQFDKVLKSLGCALIAIFLYGQINAQVSGYTYSFGTGETIESGPFNNLIGPFCDDCNSSTTSIGFTFNYGGIDYNTFSATSNGILRFGGGATTQYTNVMSTLVGPYLIPYWDDNYTDSDGSVGYALLGVSGSQKLVVDFRLSYLGFTGTADKSFQIWLYEGTNEIRFVYGAGNNQNENTLFGGIGFSIGILTNGLSDFQSITVAGNTMSTLVTNDNNSVWPGVGTYYNFSPVPLCNGPSFLTCPTNITVNNVPTNCGRVVNYTLPTFDGGDCGGATMTQVDGTGLSSGDLFPVGTTTQTYQVVDANGNTATCTFNVIVLDVENPTITPLTFSDITVNNTPDLCGANVPWLEPTASDNCPGVSMVASHVVGSFFPVGTTTVTYTATDASGNSTSLSFDVIVIDNQLPTITCPADIMANTDANECFATFASIGNAIGFDNCGINTVTNDAPANFPVGSTTVTWTAEDFQGNTVSCTQLITVTDIELPTALCQDIIVQLDAAGAVTIAGIDVDNGSDDACGIATYSVVPSSFNCGNVGANAVILSVEDNNGNESTCSAVVTVQDITSPIATCQDVTLQLDVDGNVMLNTIQVDNGSSDACGIASLSLSQTAYDCSHVGIQSVTLTVTDVNGNASTCTADITIEDNIAPVAVCQNIAIQLDAAGNASIVAADIDNGSNDACGIASLSASTTTFDCSNVGVNSVTLTVTDNNSNSSTCSADVTIEDNVAPIAICQNLTVQLDAAGDVTITAAQIDNGSNDACGIASLSLSQTDFDCSHVGTNSVTLTVTDVNGNTSTCSSTVTVEDIIAPNALCQNITVQLDALGTFTVTGAQVDNGSDDACGIATLVLAPNTFTCSEVGVNAVVLTVTDVNGNASTCTADVTVEDNVAPTMICQDITILLDGTGNATITAGDIDNGSNDACGIATLSATPTTFNCLNIGANNVTLTATDVNGNSASCTSVVTVLETTAPTALCADITLQLDVLGLASITGLDIDGGSTDNCGIASWTPSQTDFDCSHVGANTVTLTVTDGSGNFASCTSTVTVEDNVAPAAICQDLTVQLDATGNATITAAQIDNGSNDACGIASLVASQTAFDCSNVGLNVITLTVTDNNGNTSTCTSDVTVEDNVAPIAICQNLTVQLDATGNATITAAQIDNGSNDACGIASLVASQTTFDCSNVGLNVITFTVTDNNGNTSTCTSDVTVEDNVAPVAICQNLTVQLDATGNATITAAQIDNGSNDACGIASLVASETAFDCSNVGLNVITLTVTDNNGNTSTCTSDVTVEDNVAPVAICQNLTVQLDATGNATIAAAQIDNGSNDACGITSLVASQTAFDCLNVGLNVITLTVTDNNGNTSTCTSDVTVEDNVAPVAICQNLTVQLDATGNATITAAQIDNGSNDACGIASLVASQTAFDCSNVGLNVITLTVTDNNGNTSTCTSDVTVEDNVAPIAICQNLTVQLDATGNATITAAQIDNGSNDACGIASLVASQTAFDCSNVGLNVITLTVTDNNENISTCTSDVTVEDNVAPVAICQNLTVQLDATGNATITAAQIDNGSNDACGITLAAAPTTFDCSNVGPNTVTLTVTDNNGNVSTCTAVATVEDNVAPLALCQDITVQLDATGNASIVAADVDNGSSDACGIASLTVSPDTFDCSDAVPPVTNLFISEYVEGSGNNKAIELYNPTPAPINLADGYKLRMYFNGSTTVGLTVNLTGTMATGSTYVVANSASSPAILALANQTAGGGWFNGDDAIILEDPAGNLLDVFGRIGEDPGAEWSVGGNTTQDNTLRRLPTVTQGVTANPAIGFPTLGTEWVQFPNDNIADLGAHTINPIGVGTLVTLTVTDNNGNVSTCTSTVTVEDNIAPNAICQDLTVQLDATGNATITAAQIDNGSTDACGIASLSLSQTAFDCSNVGPNAVTLTVTDIHGNSATCISNVTVEDNVAPVAICQNLTVQLDATGNATITAAQIDNGSNDACGIASLVASQTAFDCSNVGLNVITLTVTDNNGNTSTCTSDVTVEDNVAPVAICQNLTVQLDATGNATITAAQIDNGSNDACGISSLVASQTAFDCSNVGLNVITLTVTDNNGNTSTCTSDVTVEDNIAPVAICQDLTIQLDALGNASITAAQLNNGSNDACGIATVSASQTAFDCSNLGANTVTLTVTDVNGNNSTCTATVTVEDNLVPTISCPSAIIVDTDPGSCDAVVVLASPITNDNCAVTVTNDAPAAFPLGNTTVTWTVTDLAGNSASCAQLVTVEDNEAPTITCPADVTVDTDFNLCIASGVALGTPVASDNCTVASVVNNAPLLFPLGTTTVTWTVTDAAGNASTCTQTVTVEDNQSPTVVCPQNIVLNNVDGSCGRVVIYPTPMVTDNCSIANMVQSDASGYTSGNIFPIGTTTQEYTATDGSGNVLSCSFSVTIVDTQFPTIVGCPADITVASGANSCDVIVTWVTPTATDNCPGVILATTHASGSLFGPGTTLVTYSATDNFGNVTTCSFNVTVVDGNAPTAPELADVYNSCQVNTLPSPVAFDICAGEIVGTTTTIFPITMVGITPVVWTFNDGNGNVTTATQYVYIDGSVDATVSILDAVTLMANNDNATYQWIDCSTGASIPGATSQTFTATANGSYAVIVTEAGCPAVTSDCFNISKVELDQLTVEAITVYPNPSLDGQFQITFSGTIEKVEVLDMLGRLISVPTANENTFIDASQLASGKYMLRVFTEQGVVSKEVIIVNK